MAADPPDRERPGEDDEEGLSDLARAYRKSASYLYIGWTLAGAMTLGTLGGYWLDQKLGTTPWLLITGAVLGMVGGFVELIRAVNKLNQKQ